ncbi:MAG TPA: hypothetical protein VK543_01080 [Puia sp.]|nr:hypothetical protein [Puia sp.]
MNRIPKRHFWEWFKRHHQEYLGLNKQSKKEAGYWLSELNAHLRAYCKFFTFSLVCQDKEAATLTITVKGKVSHFKMAEAFVATAPEIPGWTILALEDPMPVEFLWDKQMEDAGIHPGELYFSFAGDDPEHADIIVYHPLCTEKNERLFLQFANTAVYHLLGERVFGMNIGYLEVANLSSARSKNVQKLEALPDCIGSRRSSMVIDGNGRLLSMD